MIFLVIRNNFILLDKVRKIVQHLSAHRDVTDLYITYDTGVVDYFPGVPFEEIQFKKIFM